jgi:hypothetical protein
MGGGAHGEDLETNEEEGAVQAVHVLGPVLATQRTGQLPQHMSSQRQQEMGGGNMAAAAAAAAADSISCSAVQQHTMRGGHGSRTGLGKNVDLMT